MSDAEIPDTVDAAYWDAEAPRFDDDPDHGLRDPDTRDAWRRLLLPLLPSRPSRIGDLGCGTGSLAVLLASEGHRVSGLDRSEPMIGIARDKARRSGVTVDLRVGDASAPPYGDGVFDVVLDRHVLWALPDPAAALGRWCRLLAPGGTLILVEGRWHTGGGLTAARVRELLGEHRLEAEVTSLTDPTLWGGPISDERYLVVSRS